MHIATNLKKNHFRVIQSEYYTDQESSDTREIDIVADKQTVIDHVLFRVSLLIECKRSTDKPWLLFTSTTTHLADPARIAQSFAGV